jgi:large subunit ribosomal protein L29
MDAAAPDGAAADETKKDLPDESGPEDETEMELDKIRNLGPHELRHEEQQASEQLFRLRFQMRLGQTEGVKKLRGLKKDIARIKTITRERELGLNAALHGSAEGHTESAPATKKAKKKTAAKRTKKPVGKKAAAKRVAKTGAKKKAATKKTATKTKKKEAR